MPIRTYPSVLCCARAVARIPKELLGDRRMTWVRYTVLHGSAEAATPRQPRHANPATPTRHANPATLGYVPMDIDFLERHEDDLVLPSWMFPARVSPAVLAKRQAVLTELGRAHLQLRIFRNRTQRDVEAASGVDQTTISRFERAQEGGLSIQRLAAMLAALGVGGIDFKPPPGPPPTALELMLYGDRWRRAGKEADRRLARPRRSRRGRPQERTTSAAL